ncbi:hypothetical protein JYQ62_37670 [Nostoc sp. UHCC 0702]|nr:hypothetical protein JYQ62_37670 [Nostoc sp. UHCC 0702]
MINPSQIKQKAESLYPQFLRTTISNEPFFPQVFSAGKRPDNNFIALREAVNQLLSESKQKLGYGYIVELKTLKTRKFGKQSIPQIIRIETEVDYLKLIKKEKEFVQFQVDVELIRLEIPELETWLYQNPFKIIKFAGLWVDLIKVCHYFQANPRPHLYMRELPIKVHTKFIEHNEAIICNLLEAILPPEVIQATEGEKNNRIFEKRFSLRYSEPVIRLRFLDKALQTQYNFPVSDFSTSISELKQLNFKECCLIITENSMNLLTLPYLPNSLAIFGSGYAIQVLKSVDWLNYCRILYWGDLDVDGFRILSQLRSYFPHTISIMMDQETFNNFEQFTVDVPSSDSKSLLHLTEEEYLLFSYLYDNEKRLEQEHISQDYVNRYLLNVLQQKRLFPKND